MEGDSLDGAEIPPITHVPFILLDAEGKAALIDQAHPEIDGQVLGIALITQLESVLQALVISPQLQVALTPRLRARI